MNNPTADQGIFPTLCLGLVLRAMDIAYMLKRADADSLKHWSPYISEYLHQWVQVEQTIPQNDLE